MPEILENNGVFDEAPQQTPQEASARREVSIPVADPHDPYKVPAAMPSSADREPRSFRVEDFAMPTKRQPDWRFTPIERISEFFAPFTPSGATKVSVSMIDAAQADTSSSPALQEAQGDGVQEAMALTSLGGKPVDPAHVQVSEVPLSAMPQGTVLKPSDRPSAVEWNSAQSATVVKLSGHIAEPVLIRLEGTAMSLDARHLVIVTDEDTHADVIIEHQGVALLAEGVEVSIGARSHVSTTFIQEWDHGSKMVASHRLRVGAEATLRHAVVTLGGDVVRIRMDQDFGGEHGDLNMLGIYFVDPGEHIEHRTMVVHNHPECKSRVVYKGALDGKGAHSTWVGNALIQPTAPGTDSYELNRNLVLTPGAIADSEPNLEIENGNIIGAGHASSVGRFDDEELFYLESRGIPEIEARKLVVRGFFGELVEEIGVPAIASHLMHVIDKRLARGEHDAMRALLEER